MKTFLGFVTGIFVGTLGFATLLVWIPNGSEIIKNAHEEIQGL